jgi:hypothetical protein
VKSYSKIKFRLSGTVYAARDRLPDKVRQTVHDALKEAFSFDKRSFGQPVALSEVMAVIQNVQGVESADIDALYSIPVGRQVEQPAPSLNYLVTAHLPKGGAAADQVQPAELLTLDESSLTSLVVKTYEL